jgi:PII-like signaling protein
MRGFKGERVLMRIHIGDHDENRRKPLYQEIVELLRGGHYAATVFRGIMGLGASSRLRTDRFLELSSDPPIVIECIETEERIQAILPDLDAMIGGGLITLERARVIMYRADLPEARRTPSESVEVTKNPKPDFAARARKSDTGRVTGAIRNRPALDTRPALSGARGKIHFPRRTRTRPDRRGRLEGLMTMSTSHPRWRSILSKRSAEKPRRWPDISREICDAASRTTAAAAVWDSPFWTIIR